MATMRHARQLHGFAGRCCGRRRDHEGLFRCIAAARRRLLAAADDEIDCNNAMGQQDMNACAAKGYDAADAVLNAVWKEARGVAKDLDAELSEDLKGAEAALLAAQRGWIAYRDGQCELAGFNERGGSMEPMVVSGCLADLTRKRTKELREFIGGGEAQ